MKSYLGLPPSRSICPEGFWVLVLGLGGFLLFIFILVEMEKQGSREIKGKASSLTRGWDIRNGELASAGARVLDSQWLNST